MILRYFQKMRTKLEQVQALIIVYKLRTIKVRNLIQNQYSLGCRYVLLRVVVRFLLQNNFFIGNKKTHLFIKKTYRRNLNSHK